MNEDTKTMVRQTQVDSESSYRNPFTDYHANRMDVHSLLDYWCDPWSVFKTFGLSEKHVFDESGPQVFEGGRGSGKTMFLRYFSIQVQKERYLVSPDSSKKFLEFLNRQGAICVYIRFDGAALSSFEGSNLSEEVWRNLFVHYFELFVAREHLVALQAICRGDDSLEESTASFLPRICDLLGCPSPHGELSLVLDEVNQRLAEITNFRAEVGFEKLAFKPTKAFGSQYLSFSIPKLIKECYAGVGPATKFIILIDEFENFTAPQQRVVNTLVKFSDSDITFRIGMRKNGWRDYGTVNEDDFIKEGRDYEKFTFEEILHSKTRGYQDFLIEVARRRLEREPFFAGAGLTDIRFFLGNREDLNDEAEKIAGSDLSRIDKYFHSKVAAIRERTLPDNKSPLVRALGYLWLIRGESIENTKVAVLDYEAGKKSELAKKFQYDLTNKYRLSLTILLASIYRKRKLYYSFNTFSYLSSGMVGHFIELCRYTFRYAEFEASTGRVEDRIPSELQARAAQDVAQDQLQQIKRIAKHGGRLYRLVENLGAIFRAYHLDLRIRYPETNQFSLDDSSLSPEEDAAFRSALMWSVIQKKPLLQGNAPKKKRTELYTLNRIFSPIFEISYRTRGGISEAYDSSDFVRLISEENVAPKRELIIDEPDDDPAQSSLFT